MRGVFDDYESGWLGPGSAMGIQLIDEETILTVQVVAVADGKVKLKMAIDGPFKFVSKEPAVEPSNGGLELK